MSIISRGNDVINVLKTTEKINKNKQKVEKRCSQENFLSSNKTSTQKKRHKAYLLLKETKYIKLETDYLNYIHTIQKNTSRH